MAARTEDHPIEYFDFEGVIPRGGYGAGDVIVWDWGTWEPEETDDPGKAVRDGELKFALEGEKLKGRFVLVRTRSDGDEEGPGCSSTSGTMPLTPTGMSMRSRGRSRADAQMTRSNPVLRPSGTVGRRPPRRPST